MSDNELIERIVSKQVALIRMNRKYTHNPLAVPARTPGERKADDEDWNEAIRRGLDEEINRRVKKIVGEEERP